ncbi:tripartite tricarboxylate transporter substrate binding protein [Xenophilus arseniciresistens]|uniref:Tripartite tricarboxylate transporter substrate binding protein n=1 Tax=Xenophilus arseniciresistens TaxID=1283306 RepID=A0AAE3N8Q1_9BURK|nr:tripartite tricarboxylate transporter substrate binding protein [Xenophilus arseniciresistens]MDA7415334.1 tripartite tricarboxylate transporter substrate binding protein [Xenophilus arseniciresistens]
MSSALPRRRVLASLAACTAALATGGSFASTPWPNKAVRIIVPFAPGGGADSSARLLADLFAPQLGQGVIVENKPGAGSAIGVTAAAQARDGHTLLMASNSMVINPSLNPQLASDPARDFDAIGMVSAQPLVLVVPANSPAKSFKELLALAKARPGMTAGNSGNGTLAHIASEIFAGQAGTQITPVAYKGESALLPEMISGLVDFGFLNLPSVAAHIKSGRVRALAVSSPQDVAELPGVPTVRALGFAALEVQGWAALLAPKGSIAPEGLTRLEGLLAQALASDAARTRFALLNVTPFVLDRAATTEFLQQETARYAGVIKARGIKAG